MQPHFYLVFILKGFWKCVLTDCLLHKGANGKKWLYSSLFKKKKTMKNKNPNFVLPPMTEAPLRAARASGSQTKLLVLFSQHIWCAMLSGPSYPLPSRQVCQAQSLEGTFTWSNIHSNHGAAHSWTDLNMGLSALNSLNLFFYKWLHHKYKFQWVSLLAGEYENLCIGNAYLIYSIERRNYSFCHKDLQEKSANSSHKQP